SVHCTAALFHIYPPTGCLNGFAEVPCLASRQLGNPASATGTGNTMGNSIFWYDFEATGIDPRRDRPLQVAGARTNEQLEEIDEPLCIDCRLAGDVLPH